VRALTIFIAIFISLIFISSSFALARKYPHGCKDVGYVFENRLLVLKPASENHPQTVYLIHNKLKKSVKLIFIKPIGQGYMPHFKNIIKANKWGSFATDQPQLKFLCQISLKKRGKRTINCGSALELCQYIRAKFPGSHMGSYWAVRSDTQRNAKYTTIKQGVLLKW